MGRLVDSHQPAVDVPEMQPKRNPLVAIRCPQPRSGDGNIYCVTTSWEAEQGGHDLCRNHP